MKNIKISGALHSALLNYCAANGTKIGFVAERAIAVWLKVAQKEGGK